jgi:hypothetical protein
MEIRKISVGLDCKDGAMHYIHGQSILNGTHKIHLIKMDEYGCIVIWIENNQKEVMQWKSFNINMPISIEYNINF